MEMSKEMIERVAKEIQRIYPLSSVGLSLTAAKIAIEAMREYFQDHYWDSLQEHKPMIMLHIDKMLSDG